jgi:methylmalonyl-CoA mutase
MNWRALAQLITALENDKADEPWWRHPCAGRQHCKVPVLGITGTGGAGKSSLTDELIRRLRLDQNDSLRVAVISIDPSRRKSGGALLGDRIRMNAINPWSNRVHACSCARLATRDFGSEISRAARCDCRLQGGGLRPDRGGDLRHRPGRRGHRAACRRAHVRHDARVRRRQPAGKNRHARLCRVRRHQQIRPQGLARRLRDVAKQVQRNKEAWGKRPDEMPVFGTMAARFNDDGVTALYQALKPRLQELGLPLNAGTLPPCMCATAPTRRPSYPPRAPATWPRSATPCAATKSAPGHRPVLAREVQQLRESMRMLKPTTPKRQRREGRWTTWRSSARPTWARRERKLLAQWPDMQKAYAGDEYVVKIRDKEIRTALTTKSLSGTTIRKVALPQYEDHGEILKWLMLDNVPGSYPYTAGTFAFKREGEDPTRMFAGEGDPFRTNTRFKLLSEGMPAKRLSTAFDSVTLYGNDPDLRPDIYGKVGNSACRIATLDDMKVLYGGFDLCNPPPRCP